MPKGTIPVVTAGLSGSYQVVNQQFDGPIIVGSPEWFQWLEEQQSFHFDGMYAFTAMRESRKRWLYWYAYARGQDGTLRSAYLGKSAKLSVERLIEIGQKVHSQEKPA